MQLRSVLLLVVALAMAGATAFLVNGWVSKRQPVAQVRPAAQEPAVPPVGAPTEAVALPAPSAQAADPATAPAVANPSNSPNAANANALPPPPTQP